MNDVDKLLARAQVGLAFFYGVGFLACIALLIFMPRPMDQTTSTILISLMGVLGTLATLQNNFFFARQRSPSLPDAGTTVTTTASTITTGDPNAPSPVIPAPVTGSPVRVPSTGP